MDAPLTCPKSKNSRVKDGLTKIRIDHGNQFMGLINLNNIIPVNDADVTLVNFEKLDFKYKLLVQTQRTEIRKKEFLIMKNANILYKKVTKYPDDNERLVACCHDFRMLEEKCTKYKK